MSPEAAALSALAGRAVMVTGAAQGIGRAVAKAVSAAGGAVYAVDLKADPLESLRAELGPTTHTEAFDVRDTPRMPELCRRARAAMGGFDSLMHVAGVIVRRSDLDEVTEEDFDLQYSVNLKAGFFLSRAAAATMDDGGAIVLFTSQGWWTGGFAGSIPYSATKGGVVSMTRGLARTLAPRRIRVNAVAPGAADTAMMREGLTDAQRDAFIGQIPLGYMASPEEVADAAVFLIRDESRYVTGTTLNVSGGQLTY